MWGGHSCPRPAFQPASSPSGSSAAARNGRPTAGVTLLELLIVITIIAAMAGLAYPSISASLDGLRLRSAADGIAGFLNSALDRAERRQEVIEVAILPQENALAAHAAGVAWVRRLEIPKPTIIASPTETRRFVLYPGGSVPRVAIDLANPSGKHRVISIDPMTGSARAEGVAQ